jgi:hypothetical protein
MFALVCFGLSPRVQAADETKSNANTGEGIAALQSVTTGTANTAVGVAALFTNTAGKLNTATGALALFKDTADRNTATGALALFKNDIGGDNTADGVLALANNTIGVSNTAVGDSALSSNTRGGENTAIGLDAMFSNFSGAGNTAVGGLALEDNTSGSFNIAIGDGAGENLTTGSNNIDIYDAGVAGDDSTIRIGAQTVQGKTFIAGIRGVTTVNADAIAVVIDSAGQLGTVSSSERFKTAIKAMDKSSEALLALKPVTFHYKNDSKGIPQFGLIAEEVAKVNSDLVVRDAEGKVYTVRYDAVNAMLLNEFLKEHRHVQQQDAIIAIQQKQIETLTAAVQKVSAQLEVSKAAPQTVVNNH